MACFKGKRVLFSLIRRAVDVYLIFKLINIAFVLLDLGTNSFLLLWIHFLILNDLMAFLFLFDFLRQ